jgi:hypothetical protein
VELGVLRGVGGQVGDLGNVAYCQSLYAAASEDMALYLTQGKSFSIPPSLFFRLRWEILLFVPR